MKYIERFLVIIIIVAINILGVYIYKRIDLTRSKAFSLSNSTQKIINELNEPVIIKLFFSKNLPAPSNDVKNYTKALLAEYQTFSKGKVSFEFVNPHNEEKFVKEANEVRITPISVEIYEKDKMEVREVYMGAVVIHKERYLLLPIITKTEGLEFLISNTIKKISDPVPRFIVYFQPMIESDYEEDEFPIPENIHVLYNILSEIAMVDRTDLFTLLPDFIDLLIVNGVRDSLHIGQLYVIDQFIMSGRPVMFFQDRYTADLRGTSALFDNNLLDMLRNYGIYIKPSLVLDAENFQVTLPKIVEEQSVTQSFFYPFFPVIKNFTFTLPVHKNLKSIVTYFPSGIYFGNQNGQNTPLLQSSDRSFERAGYIIDTNFESWANFNYQNQQGMESKIIASLYTGQVDSYFRENSLKIPGYVSSTPKAHIFVCGTTSLTFNSILANNPDNATFLLNMVDYLTGFEEYIYMRTRDISHSPLKKLSYQEKRIIKYLNLVLPLFIILIGGGMFHLVCKKHKRDISK